MFHHVTDIFVIHINNVLLCWQTPPRLSMSLSNNCFSMISSSMIQIWLLLSSSADLWKYYISTTWLLFYYHFKFCRFPYLFVFTFPISTFSIAILIFFCFLFELISSWHSYQLSYNHFWYRLWIFSNYMKQRLYFYLVHFCFFFLLVPWCP